MNPIFKKNEKLLAIITAIVIFGAFIFSLIINPKLAEHKKSLDEAFQLNLKLSKMQGDLLIKDNIEQVYSQIEPLMAGEGTDQQKISLFTRQLSELYSKLNIKINSIKILPVTNENYYKYFLIRVEMSGHVKEILKFIFSVETASVPLKIEQCDFKSQDITDNVRASFVIGKIISDKK